MENPTGAPMSNISFGGAGAYNINPAATQGSGTPYGMVPGPTGAPPNQFDQINSYFPGTTPTGQSALNVIGQQIAGVVPTDVRREIQDTSAEFGVGSGMPGSGLQHNLTLRDLGLSSIQEQNQGMSNYLGFLGGTGSLMTNPGLLADLSQSNALYNSAPDPRMAAEQLLQEYYQGQNPAGDSGELGRGKGNVSFTRVNPATGVPIGTNDTGYF
jgi:hypothetical protein